MNDGIAGQILTEVRQLGDRLDAKIDGVREELGGDIADLSGRVGDLSGRVDQLKAATEHNHDRLAESIEALRIEVVRTKRNKR